MRNEADAASDDSRNPEDQDPPAPAAIVERGPQDVTEPANADEGNPRGDEPTVLRAAVPPPAMRPLAELMVTMDRAALALLSDAELQARQREMAKTGDGEIKRATEMKNRRDSRSGTLNNCIAGNATGGMGTISGVGYAFGMAGAYLCETVQARRAAHHREESTSRRGTTCRFREVRPPMNPSNPYLPLMS